MSLHKSMLNKQWVQKKQAEPASSGEIESIDDETKEPSVKDSSEKYIQNISKTQGGKKHHDNDFHDHAKSMRLFNESHKLSFIPFKILNKLSYIAPVNISFPS